MKKLLIVMSVMLSMTSIAFAEKNIFFEEFTTPYQTFPFDRLKISDYEPAVKMAIEEAKKEIEAIVSNKKKPTFQNTIVPLERSGARLELIQEVAGNLMSAETSDELVAVVQRMTPLITEYETSVSFNKALFARVKAVYDKEYDKLQGEDKKLLEDTYKSFTRNGVNLPANKQEELKKIKQELQIAKMQFGQNALKDKNSFELLVTDKERLAVMPQSALDAAALAAKERGKEGYLFTFDQSSYSALLKYCPDEEYRKYAYTNYLTIGAKDNEYNNFDLVRKIVNLSRRSAQILGYNTYADFVLEKRMAKTPTKVYEFLNQLADAYKPTAIKEFAEIEQFAGNKKLEAWDVSYWSNKYKEAKYSMDDEALKPYFALENVRKGIFGLAGKLYGLTYKEVKNIPVYHKDVSTYEVYDRDGVLMAVLYLDFFPRASKRAGAWMTLYRSESIDDNGKRIIPHISIVTNFTKPTEDKPALLTFYEVETFLHEFGHGLHATFANTKYHSLSSPNVYWDFVELPSQFNENFSTQKEFLNTFAHHYQTGELLPDSLRQKILDTRNYNVAIGTMGQLRYGLLDMAYYSSPDEFTEQDIPAFEQQAWAKAVVTPQVTGTCMTTQFNHIMNGGYSAGYYSYKWSEVLEADCFGRFLEEGVFNTDVAESFRKNILEPGGTVDPSILFRNFRGRDPQIDALLKRNGLK